MVFASMLKYFTFLSFLYFWFSFTAFANGPFSMNIGDSIVITSDKGLRKGDSQIFEAFGNVVITQKAEVIYGEVATYDINEGIVSIKGNTRYVGPLLSLYGQELIFNVKDGTLTVQNARLMASGYTIVGDMIKKISANTVLATNAQYSTCTDCPQSWSIYGRDIRLEVDEYIYITKGIIKMNGVSVMFLPYVILPIKRKRQTGLLFPKFKFNFKTGLEYTQPFFWAIHDYNDLTLSPFAGGARGHGAEIEYRHSLGENKQFTITSLNAWDNFYNPNHLKGNEKESESGMTIFRHVGDYEHHYQYGNWLNHHFYAMEARDLDLYYDFNNRAKTRLIGPNLGVGGFFNPYTSYLDLSVESYQNRSILGDNPRGYDNTSVQMPLKVTANTTTHQLIQSKIPGFQSISVGLNSDYIELRQKRFANFPQKYIRNANRLQLYPYLQWNLGNIGPMKFETLITKEYNHYHFPFMDKKEVNWAEKTGTTFVNKASFEIEKIFGLSYNERLIQDEVETEVDVETDSGQLKQSNKLTTDELIGHLDQYQNSYVQDYVNVVKRSYRHSALFNFKHHYMSDQKFKGNERFEQQLRSNTGNYFDVQDLPREIRNVSHSFATQTEIPTVNTLEFEMQHSLFRKTANAFSPYENRTYLHDQYTYDKIAYFNVSQGFLVNPNKKNKAFNESEFKNRFTRLATSTGFALGQWNFGITDYYFSQSGRHIAIFNIKRTFWDITADVGYRMNELNVPMDKFLTGKITLGMLPKIKWHSEYDYDIRTKTYMSVKHQVLYEPNNKCWKFLFSYFSHYNQVSGFAIDFLVNFGDNVYTSLLSPGERYGF